MSVSEKQRNACETVKLSVKAGTNKHPTGKAYVCVCSVHLSARGLCGRVGECLPQGSKGLHLSEKTSEVCVCLGLKCWPRARSGRYIIYHSAFKTSGPVCHSNIP